MAQFSTNESVSLEKHADTETGVVKTALENISSAYELERCGKWIQDNDYKKVCLQFPDYLLPDSAEVVYQLEKLIKNKVYILGDTAYGSCCIDYVAASHISADAIIHYGRTCFSKPENIIPSLNVYEKHDLNVSEFNDLVRSSFGNKAVSLLIDSPFYWKLDEIKTILRDYVSEICTVQDNLNLDDAVVVYLGENDRKLMNIYLQYSPKELYYKSKSVNSLQSYRHDNKILQRRYFLIEKIKDSNVIGLVLGTLAVKNYLKILDRIKTLITNHSKKYYVLSVGKPTVAKLANFQEIDVFVIIGCALNEIYENRDYYKPIVTPHDVEVALNPSSEKLKFTYDYNSVIDEDIAIVKPSDDISSDVSLVTGKIRVANYESVETTDADNKIALKTDGTLRLNSDFGAGFLAGRSWRGLEQDLGQTEPQLAAKGRSGVAHTYENESTN